MHKKLSICFLQISVKAAFYTSCATLLLSLLLSSPFIYFAKLHPMFLEPGEYDHISFCVEDISQKGQVHIFCTHLHKTRENKQ